MPMKAHKEEDMNFKVKKAEAIYTGGGIYVYCGITEDGQHFMAGDEPEWVMLTNEPTMTDELSDDEWNDRWYPEWQDEHKTYETESDEESMTWVIAIYNWLMENGESYYHDDMQYRRDITINELQKMPTAWKGYRMTNSELIQYHAICSGWLLNSNSEDAIDEYRRVQNELLRRMEDFVDEPRRL